MYTITVTADITVTYHNVLNLIRFQKSAEYYKWGMQCINQNYSSFGSLHYTIFDTS